MKPPSTCASKFSIRTGVQFPLPRRLVASSIRLRSAYFDASTVSLMNPSSLTFSILSWPHREVVWVIFGQISSGCLLLLLPLWACGQRTCVVHHVHSDVGRAA